VVSNEVFYGYPKSIFYNNWFMNHSFETIDGLVIGAGIVGLACAYQLHLAHPKLQLCILDKEAGPAVHQTGHNSGVLHSGIYYAPGSLKAENCLQGKAAMQEFCQREGIPFDICGKVIVAKHPDEFLQLEKLQQRALQHGIQVQQLDDVGLRDLEPHVVGLKALHIKSAGIVNYTRVSERLLEILLSSGRHRFVPHFKVRHITHSHGGVEVSSEQQTLKAKWGINAAGLYSDKIFAMSGQTPNYRIIPFRGEYYKLKESRRHLCRNLIYPVPDPSFPFLGVHLTRMIGGEVECGPNAVLALAREGYTWGQIDFNELWECLSYPGFQQLAKQHFKAGIAEMTRSFFKSAFAKSLQELVPEIKAEDLIKAPAGIRAQALEINGKLMDDFHFVANKPWLHLCNVPSPAATSSLNIGKVAMHKLASMGCLN